VTTIDLRNDAGDIQQMLVEAAKKYAAKHKAPAAAKAHPHVTRIDLTFSLGDGVSTPWVHLNFDTKPGSEPDGDPTHPDFAKLTREAWLPAVHSACDGERVTVVTQNGKMRQCGDAKLTEGIGNYLVDMLLEARSKGVFSELPIANRCELGVEDPTTGEFGWPAYDDRGKKNLVL
jgi:hypothetical protein